MGRGRLLRPLAAFGVTVLVAAVAATAARAQTVYCVNGSSMTLPTTITGGGGSFVFTEFGAEFVLASPEANGTFYVGISIATGGTLLVRHRPPPFNPATILQPGFSTNTVARGACAGALHPVVPGAAFMCGAGYGESSTMDFVAGRDAVDAYLSGQTGRRYASFVLGNLAGAQLAQPILGAVPTGSFFCALPTALRVEPIIGPDGKQMLADTQGTLYPSGYANMETIGHPAFRVVA